MIALALPDHTTARIEEESSERATKVGQGSGNHEVRVVDRSEFLPVDRNHQVARGRTQTFFKHVRNDDPEPFEKGLTGGSLGRNPVTTGGYPDFGVRIEQSIKGNGGGFLAHVATFGPLAGEVNQGRPE